MPTPLSSVERLRISALIGGALNQIVAVTRWAAGGLLALAVVMSVAAGLMSPPGQAASIGFCAAVLALAMVSMATGAFTGGIIGFLFGIPRLLNRWQRDTRDADDVATRQAGGASFSERGLLLSNSNLEEVSDWITKIIVGMTLINLPNVPGWLQRYSDWLAASLGAASSATSAAGVFIAILTVAACLLDFLFMYLQTRTSLTLLFLDVEHMREVGWQADAESLSQQPQTERAGATSSIQAGRPAKAAPIDADSEIIANPPAQTATAATWAAWAAACYRNDRFKDAADGWRRAIEKERGNPAYWIGSAEALEQLNRDREAVRAYATARELGADPWDMRLNELRVSLYVRPPDGFRHAIDVASDLMRDPRANNSDDPAWSWLRFWRIAAEGQRHAYLVKSGASVTRQEEARDKVRDLVRELVTEVPDPTDPVRIWLDRLLAMPPDDEYPKDRDLESLQTDAEIVGLIRNRSTVE